MLIRIGQLLQPADNVSAREIPLGVTKILLRQAEVLSGGTEAAMVVAVAVVAVVAVVTVVTVVAMVVVVVVAEQSLQEIETWKASEHSFLSCSLAVPAPASCRRSRPSPVWCRGGETPFTRVKSRE
jgi:hypothetical protein